MVTEIEPDQESASPRHAAALRALLVPADPTRPTAVIQIADTAAAFSHALGDVLLDSITAEHASHRYALYLPDDPTPQPDNPRAAVLAARLGLHDRAIQARLRGDVLVTGLHPDRDDDHNVPPVVLDAVHHIGSGRPAPVRNDGRLTSVPRWLGIGQRFIWSPERLHKT